MGQESAGVGAAAGRPVQTPGLHRTAEGEAGDDATLAVKRFEEQIKYK